MIYFANCNAAITKLHFADEKPLFTAIYKRAFKMGLRAKKKRYAYCGL